MNYIQASVLFVQVAKLQGGGVSLVYLGSTYRPQGVTRHGLLKAFANIEIVHGTMIRGLMRVESGILE